MKQFEDKVAEIETIIHKYMPTVKGHAGAVLEAMNYSVDAGGKRLRPMLMLETYRFFRESKGGAVPEAMVEPFAAAIEMIHTYSLIHDDLPALDNDDLRRGKPTTHKQFGEDIAILAGDGLLNYAYETAMKAYDLISREEEGELEYTRLLIAATKVLAQKPGINGMVGGQTLDVVMTGQQPRPDQIDYIYENKTAALIEASMMIGAILGGAGEEEVKQVHDMASLIGFAFQIQDDILDVEGDPQLLGKPLHSDEDLNKYTYVTVRGMEHSKEAVAQLSKEALEIYDRLDGKNPFLRELIQSLVNRQK